MDILGTGAGVMGFKFQIGSYRSIIFDFGIDVSSWTFELFIKKNKGDRLKTISLTLGSGLSFPVYASDQVMAVFANSITAIEEGEYYIELRRTDIILPLVGGLVDFSFDAPQGTVDDSTQSITVTSQTISLAIANLSSVSEISERLNIHAWAGTVTLPDNVGAGYFIKFNSDCTVPYLLGSVFFAAGTLAVSLGANSGSAANWYAIARG